MQYQIHAYQQLLYVIKKIFGESILLNIAKNLFNFYYFSICSLFIFSFYSYSLFCIEKSRVIFFSPRVIGGWKPEYPEENHPSQSLKEEVNQCLTRFGDPLPSKPN